VKIADSIPGDSSALPTRRKWLSPLAIVGLICVVVVVVVTVVGTTLIGVGTFRASGLGSVSVTSIPDDPEEPVTVAPSDSVPESHATPAEDGLTAESKALPSWVPTYAGLLKPAGDSRTEENGLVKGTATLETADPLDKVSEFYVSQLKVGGFEVTVDKKMTRQSEQADIAARKEDGKRVIHVAIRSVKERTVVTISYEGAEPAEAP
jgi:hypothetical protein